MGERQWTEGQRHCIEARGGTVLVSAAAGSGKTAVLIERIVSLLCDTNNPVSIDTLLVVTFTKAAAAEMRSRLNGRIAALIAKDPRNRHLLRQQMLLPQATICTIDSFCAQLLREQATKIGISPRFRVAEDTALRVMKNEIAEQVISEAYAANDPSFRKLCDLLTTDRSDSRLTEQLLQTYDFIQAHPFPLQWLDRQVAPFAEDRPLSDTVWGQLIIGQATTDLRAAQNALLTAVDDMSGDERMETAYGTTIAVTLDGIDRLFQSLSADWDTLAGAVRAISFPRAKTLKGYEDEAFKEHITSLRNYAKDLINDSIKPLFVNSETEAKADIAAAAPIVQSLFDLVKAFSAAFSKAKIAQNMLDFNDMEHLALSLLAEPNEDGSFTRTEAAREIGARFTHIMVDEYQDTNATQDTLFSALSDNENNLFFVGDIKQSIYGFRQAMPSIFRHRREQGIPYNGKDFPATITLGNNFRSRHQVTDAVNFFFRQWMHRDTGGIVYDQGEELVSSAVFANPDSDQFDTELLVTEKKTAIEDDLSTHQAEARLVGRRIRSMMQDGFCVSGKQGLRPAEYRDFCVLLRSTSHAAPFYVKELQSMGIPVSTGSRDNFFECSEIRTALSILRTIDNPMLDIPMLASLMSPVFGFSPDDTIALRARGRDLSFFDALRQSARRHNPFGKRCAAVLDILSRYRTLAAAMPVDQLIRRLYEDTGLLSLMAAKSGGNDRIANLRHLYDLARHFEQDDLRGLSAFVRYMDKLEAASIPVASASKDSDNQNAVRVMTIHRSKGLEFPVVFVGGLGTTFNTASTKSDILLHADYGIGMVLRNRDDLTQTKPMFRNAIAGAIKHSERTEELRVLYVAMTRAKDKLVLLAAVDNLTSTLSRLTTAAGTGPTLPASCILHASRMSDWVLAAALRHPAGKALGDILQGNPAIECHTDGLCITPVTADDLQADIVTATAEQEEMTLDGIDERLHFEYPYAALGQIPAKVAASQTAHRIHSNRLPPLERPAFLSKTGLTPAERGTATHRFLEAVVLGAETADKQAERMVACGQLSEVERQALDYPALDRFLQSELSTRMAASPMLLKEFPFALERPVSAVLDLDLSALPSDAADEAVLVQGMADAVFEEDGALVIVDYKTDRVKTEAELVERYRPQLTVYKEALSSTLQRPVKECILYSFHLHKAIPV